MRGAGTRTTARAASASELESRRQYTKARSRRSALLLESMASFQSFSNSLALVWMVLGFVVYFLYGKRNSKLQQGIVVVPAEMEEQAFIHD